MSSNAFVIAPMNPCVSVTGHDRFDSTPNLSRSAAGISAPVNQHDILACRPQAERKLTADPVPVMVLRPEARPPELVPRAEPARAQLPGLATREQVVLEERMRLARVRTEHQPQPQQVSVDPAASRRLADQRGVRLQRAPQEFEPGRVLHEQSATDEEREWAKERTYRALRVGHGEDPRAAVRRERADRLGAAVLEEPGERSLVRRGEVAARAVPCELQRHLDERVRRETSWRRITRISSARRSRGGERRGTDLRP